MDHDILILQCPNPECGQSSPIRITSPYTTGETYGIENAPLFAISEVNHASKKDTIGCIHCGISIYMEVCFAARTRYLSDREREGKMDGLPWRTV